MSSSIFSSENLRAWWGLPVAEKRRHLLVVLLLATLLPAGHRLAAAVDEALLPWSGLAPFVLARQALSESTEVVFAGSSHVVLGIRPDAVSSEAMNIAGPGWDYRALEAAVRANLERTPNLRLAVVELDLFPMRIDASIVQQGHCRSLRVWGIGEDEVRCRDRPVEGSLGGLGAAIVPTPRLTPWAVWKIVEPRFTGPVETRRPIPGHRRVLAVGDPAAHGPRRVEWLRKRFGGRYVEPNRAALERLVGLLLERGVEVVLLRMPHQASYTESVPEPWTRQIERTVRRLRVETGAELPVWNLERAPGFEPSDFMDSVHLNASGVEKLAERLAARIAAQLGADTKLAVDR